MYRVGSVVALFACLVLAACGMGEASGAVARDPVSGQLTLTGSSTVAPLASEIARRFEVVHPGVRIDVQTGGSSRGIRDAREGTADIGMASRALKEAEQEGLVAHAIALDEIAVILHAGNPLTSLSDAQIRGIYLGEISRWGDVGGQDAPITVVNKASGRATLEVFVEYFGIDQKAIEADVVIGDNEQGVKTVAGNPDAIGYVSVGTARYNATAGVPIKVLPSAGVRADRGRRIARPLNLVTPSKIGPLARSFIAYSQSSDVHDLVSGLYFEPLVAASAP